MINFPDSPAVNQVFASGLFTYKWDGTVWMDQGANYGDAPADGKDYLRFNATWVQNTIARLGLPNFNLITVDSAGWVTLPNNLSVVGTMLTVGNGLGSAVLQLNKANGFWNYIEGRQIGKIRWQLFLGDNASETGGNAGSNFNFIRYDDSGASLGSAFSIIRSTGLAALAGDVTIGGNTSIAGNLLSCAGNQMGLRWDGGSFTYLGFQTPSTPNWCLQWNRTNGALNWLGASQNVLVGIDPSGNITAPGINTTATGYNYATHIRLGAGSGTATLANFNWYDDGTAPGYLWGSSDAVNMRVYPPSRLSVAYATNSGGSGAVNGISGWNYSNRTKNPVYIWCTDGSGADQYLTQPGYLNVSYANSAGSAPANGGTATNSNQLGGLGAGAWLQNSSSALISIRNNGAAQLLANISGSGDSWFPVNPPSDANLKKNIAPSRIDALADVMQIEFVEFQYRDDIPWHAGENDPPDHPAFFQIDDGRLHRIGVTTQQLRTIHPDLVNSELGTHSTPDKDELLWRALRSIQQLGAKVEALTVRIAELEKERP